MKIINIFISTVERARHIIEKYEVKNPTIWQPCEGSRGMWTIAWISSDNKGMRVGISMLLFPTVVKLLLRKYGKTIEDLLLLGVKKTKDKKLIRALWKHLEDEKKTALMAEFLGGK